MRHSDKPTPRGAFHLEAEKTILEETTMNEKQNANRINKMLDKRAKEDLAKILQAEPTERELWLYLELERQHQYDRNNLGAWSQEQQVQLPPYDGVCHYLDITEIEFENQDGTQTFQNPGDVRIRVKRAGETTTGTIHLTHSKGTVDLSLTVDKKETTATKEQGNAND